MERSVRWTRCIQWIRWERKIAGKRRIAAIVLTAALLSGWGASVSAQKPSPLPVGPVDVLIDAGHGGIDGGTKHGDLLEKHLNLAVAKKLYERLLECGVRVALNRYGDFALSDDNDWLDSSRHRRDLAQRKLLIDALKPKLTVSLHANWASKPSKRGPTVLYQFNQPSYVAAGIIQQHLNRLFQTSEVPYFGKTFYLLNRSETPAVIVEMGFISNARDRELLTSPEGQKQIAEALASAILEYLLVFCLPAS